MDPVIHSLVRLQELNLEIARLDARLSQIPAELKAIDDEQQAVSSALARAKEHLADVLKHRRDHERSLADLEGKISKYNDQSREVKTNEQYRAILSEIQNVRSQIGEIEEKILLCMEEADALEKQIKDEERSLAAHKAEFDSRRGKCVSERDRVAAERDRIKRDSIEASTALPSETLELYTMLARLRGGVAMARAREERCLACNVRIRPQVFSDVRRNAQIIQCESCKRILYFVEEAPPAGEAASAPEPSPA